jgi:hypothetical protein
VHLPTRAVQDSVRPVTVLPEPPIDAPASASTQPFDHLSPSAYDRLGRAIRTAWPALVVYGVTAFLHLIVLAVMDQVADGPGVRSRLLSWDAMAFVGIAEHGYADDFTFTPQGELTGNNLAYLPLFPALIRVVHTVTGLDYLAAAVVSAHLSLITALIVVHQLLTRLYGRRTATIATVLLVGAQPMGLVYFMGYSESLFLALAAATLLALHRGAWLTAGAFALLTGLTRPTAVAVVAAVAVAVVMHLIRTRRFTWRPVAAAMLGASGTPLYLWWVGERLGRLNAWFQIQEAGWGTHWDYGRAFVEFLGEALAKGDGWVPVSTAVLVLVVLATSVTAVTDRPGIWPPLLVYGLAVLVIALGQSNYYHCKLRMLIPALIFLVPLARALAEARTRTTVAVLTGACLFGCWYGAYILTTWAYAI